MNPYQTTARQIGADIQSIEPRDVEQITTRLANRVHSYETRCAEQAARAQRYVQAFIVSLQRGRDRSPYSAGFGAQADVLLGYGFAAGYAAGLAAATLYATRGGQP